MAHLELRDESGLPLTGADPSSLAHFTRAGGEFRCFIGDPVASVDAALAESPDFVMAHVFKGFLFALATEKAAMSVARQHWDAALRIRATPREKAHVAALGALVDGHWHRAGRLLGELSDEVPLDSLALQTGHQIDFFTGNAAMLHNRIANALPSWSDGVPGFHAVLGMHAFGLEEMGDYAAAERVGRSAVEREPRDGWAQHAVAHVMEMQCRQRDGIGWMRGNQPAWTGDSLLQVHNWWHVALFHYELGEIDAVLALFDGPIYGDRSPLALNMLDASALLWRLMLGGVDVGGRWQDLARCWTPLAKDGLYAFNDMHAMMAFVGAGLEEPAQDLLAAQREAMLNDDDNAGFTRDVGHPAALAVQAFAQARYDETVALLRPLPAIAHRFGGSHAQRDVIDLTLMEAAIRAGQSDLAIELATKRRAARPASPLSDLLARRASLVEIDTQAR